MKKKSLTSTNGANHRCFTRQFNRLVARAGGQWVVIAGGQVVRVGPKRTIKRMIQEAKARHPADTLLVAPIPTEQDLQCVL